MKRIFNDNPQSIGNTPLVRLNRIPAGAKAVVLAKIEGRNPSYSVKCRIGAAMIWDAEEKGLLKPGVEIIEPTSGNTGIALAYVAARPRVQDHADHARNHEHRTAPGAAALRRESHPHAGAEGMKGAINRAEDMAASDPSRYFMPQQFKNPANPAIH